MYEYVGISNFINHGIETSPNPVTLSNQGSQKDCISSIRPYAPAK
jgi:hypothetical protein